MRLLLPPSEAKNPGGRGRSLQRRPDAAHALGAPRARLREALAELLNGPPAGAAAALLLPGGVATSALAVNARVSAGPTTPALRRYCGVLYDGLDYATLPVEVQRRADRQVLIFSGLFGVVRGDEPVPDYRVPAKATLPGVGIVATFWRPRLEPHLATVLGRGLVVDLRSGDYAAMARITTAPTVAVRVVSPRPDGSLGVVSFASKLAKGQLAALLLRREAEGDEVRSAQDIATVWTAATDHPARVTGGRSAGEVIELFAPASASAGPVE